MNGRKRVVSGVELQQVSHAVPHARDASAGPAAVTIRQAEALEDVETLGDGVVNHDRSSGNRPVPKGISINCEVPEGVLIIGTTARREISDEELQDLQRRELRRASHISESSQSKFLTSSSRSKC